MVSTACVQLRDPCKLCYDTFAVHQSSHHRTSARATVTPRCLNAGFAQGHLGRCGSYSNRGGRTEDRSWGANGVMPQALRTAEAEALDRHRLSAFPRLGGFGLVTWRSSSPSVRPLTRWNHREQTSIRSIGRVKVAGEARDEARDVAVCSLVLGQIGSRTIFIPD